MHPDMRRALDEIHRNCPQEAVFILDAVLASTEYNGRREKDSTGDGRAATQGSTASLFDSEMQTSTMVPPAHVSATGRVNSKAETLNDTQLERFLLLRSDAYAMLSMHERSLRDAEAAVEVSKGVSPLAYFAVGRQHRNLWAIDDAVLAFNTAEVLIASVLHRLQQQSGAGKGRAFSGTQCAKYAVWNQGKKETDQEFWANQGFSPQEVLELGITREEYEMQQQEMKRSREERKRQLHPPTSPSASSSPTAEAVEELSVESLSDVQLLSLFGMDNNELGAWRKISCECKALQIVNVHQTIPTQLYTAALELMFPKVNAVSSGILIAIENGTTQNLSLVGSQLRGGAYFPGHNPPQCIECGHVGLAPLASVSSWVGFSGSLCFEVGDNLCAFLYFDNPKIKSRKGGVRLIGHASTDLCLAYAEVNAEAGAGRLSPSRGGAATTAGLRAVAIPVNSVWMTRHTAVSHQRRLKVSVTIEEATRVIHFSVEEAPQDPPKPIDLLMALEYGGAPLLKKMSTINRSWRRVVNRLPPYMFSPCTRATAYPDYQCTMDRIISPWFVRDPAPIVWHIVQEMKTSDRTDLSLCDPSRPHAHILWGLYDMQSHITTVMTGEVPRRSIVAQLKDDWSVFANNACVVESALGNQYAHLEISTSPNSPGPLMLYMQSEVKKFDYLMYVARKPKPIITGAVRATHADPVAARGVVVGTVTSAAGGPTIVGKVKPATAAATVVAGSAPHAVSGGERATVAGSVVTSQPCSFSVWKTKQECGASLVNSQPKQTNSGEELMAEVFLSGQSGGVASSDPQLPGRRVYGEVKLYPGADALLVALMIFASVRM